MHTTNLYDTLITVSADCPARVGTPPAKPGTIAGLQFALLSKAPYRLTSDELLLAIEVERKGPVPADVFFATSHACLRASPLVKTHGYGLHHDSNGHVALVAAESPEYANLLADPSITKRAGMRNARA